MQKPDIGESAILSSCFFWAIGATLIKLVSVTVNVFFISFCNFTTGIILGIILLIFSRKQIMIRDYHYLLLRGILGVISMILYFWAIQLTNSGRATLLNTTFPIFSAIFGFLLFQETITRNIVIGLLLCVGGTFLIFFDKSGGRIMGNFIGLLSGGIGGMAAQYVKKASERNASVIVYLAACAVGSLVTAFAVPEAINLNGKVLLMLIIIGSLTFAGQILMVYGFKCTTATKASIMMFFKIPLTLMLSFFLLQETMKQQFIIGTILILAGLVLNSWKIGRNKIYN